MTWCSVGRGRGSGHAWLAIVLGGFACGSDSVGQADCVDEACPCVAGEARCGVVRERCSDGAWVAEPCADGLLCDQGACVTCSEGKARCGPAGREICSGAAWHPDPCAEPAPCIGDGVCASCTPGEQRCDGDLLERCDDAGLGYDKLACPPDAPRCSDGACVACRETITCGSALLAWSSDQVLAGWLAPITLFPEPVLLGSFTGELAELTGDVDGDGDTDLIAWRSDRIEIAIAGVGSYGAPSVWHEGSWAAARARLVGDVDGDGKSDLAEWTDGGVRVLRSTGSGLESPVSWLEGDFGGGKGHLLADVDGDGRDDLLAVVGADAWVARSTGTAFDVAVLWSGEIPTGEHDYHAGDFDGDGADDLLAWAYSQQQVALSTHTAFAPAQPWHTGDFWAGSLAVPFNIVHDIHGDGRADLLAPAPWGLYVLVSDGSSLGQVIYMQGAVDQTVDRGYRAGQLCRAHPDCG